MSYEYVKRTETIEVGAVKYTCAVCLTSTVEALPDNGIGGWPTGWITFQKRHDGHFSDADGVCSYRCLELYAVRMQCQEAPV